MYILREPESENSLHQKNPVSENSLHQKNPVSENSMSSENNLHQEDPTYQIACIGKSLHLKYPSSEQSFI